MPTRIAATAADTPPAYRRLNNYAQSGRERPAPQAICGLPTAGDLGPGKVPAGPPEARAGQSGRPLAGLQGNGLDPEWGDPDDPPPLPPGGDRPASPPPVPPLVDQRAFHRRVLRPGRYASLRMVLAGDAPPLRVGNRGQESARSRQGPGDGGPVVKAIWERTAERSTWTAPGRFPRMEFGSVLLLPSRRSPHYPGI